MADPKFQTKLNELLNNASVIESDFVTYITMLIDLTKQLEHKIGFRTYASIVKKWISGFKKIFGENRVPESAPTYRSKFCAVITKIYLSLLRSFHRFEPSYTQEFFSHWKSIASPLDATKRAESFKSYIQKFKIVIQHLRTAVNRCEQFSILSVLKLYVEDASISDWHCLREDDTFQIVNKIVQLMNEPTVLNQHAFLYDINQLELCIESLKPKRIICEKLGIEYDNSEYEMWLDFNKADKSVIFVSLANNGSQTLAVGGCINMRENVYDDRILQIRGVWNVTVNKNGLVQKKTTVNVYLLNDVQSSISHSVKNVFHYDHRPGHGGSVSQADTRTEITESTIKDITMPPKKLRRTEDSVVPSVSAPRFITQPFAQLERSDSRFSLPGRQKMEKLNVSVRLCPDKDNTGVNIIITDQRDADASNRTWHAGNPIVSSDAMIAIDRRSLTDSNFTNVNRVNPIAAKQSENDRVHREGDYYDEILRAVDPWTQNESEAIRGDVLSDLSVDEKRLAADDVNSEISQRELIFDGEDDGMETCEPEQDTDDCYSNNAEKQSNNSFGNKQIHVIGDILIAPPNSRNERVESPSDVPLDYLLSKGIIKFLHFSQVEERLTATRIETFNSQPTTKRETFSVKSSPNQRRVDENLRYNEPIQLPPQISIEDSPTKTCFQNQNELADESDGSTVTLNSSQKRFKRLNRAIELSTEKSQKTQKLSSSQIQYYSFAPLATSTPKSQLDNILNSQNATEMSTHNSSQSKRSNLGSMPEMFSQPTTATQATSKLPTWNNLQNRSDSLSDANGTSHAKNFQTESKFRNASFIPPAAEIETSQEMPSQESSALPVPHCAENMTIFNPPTETEFPTEAMNSSQQETQALPAIRPASNSPSKTSSSQQQTKVSDPTPAATQATQRNSTQTQASKMKSTLRATGVNTKAKGTGRKSQIPTRKQVSTSATQNRKEALNSTQRYSSLNRSKGAARTSSNDGAGNVTDNATEKQLNEDATDNVQIDDSGKVYDRDGCVFADNAELQRVAQFYIANDGLEFMKTEYFKGLPAKNRQKYERKLRTIHEMINHGLEGLHCHDEKEVNNDPYETTEEEYVVQKAERKSKVHVTKEVSVKISREHTIAHNSKKVTFSRRVSKMFYIVDGKASNHSKQFEKFNKEKKVKSMNNSNNNATNTVPLPVKPSVNLTSKMNENGQKKIAPTMQPNRDEEYGERPPSVPESVAYDDRSSLMDSDQPLVVKNVNRAKTQTTTKKRPIYAKAEVTATQEQENNDVFSTSKAKIRSTSRFPIYASDEMVAAKRVKFNSSTIKEKPNQPLSYSEPPSSNTNCVANSPIDDSSENRIDVCAKRRCERVEKLRGICSTMTCNINDLIFRLEEMAKKPLHSCQENCNQHKAILMQFIDRLQPSQSKQTSTVTGCLQLFNFVVTSLESFCSEASERFPSFQK